MLKRTLLKLNMISQLAKVNFFIFLLYRKCKKKLITSIERTKGSLINEFMGFQNLILNNSLSNHMLNFFAANGYVLLSHN